MANSKYESSRSFELRDAILPSLWIVIRIDGRGSHRSSERHNFTKPNDRRALGLMNAAAKGVLTALPDICIAYGMSDEYSFVFHKETSLFSRRQSKLVSTIVSIFTAEYVYQWREFMSGDLRESGVGDLPSFDGRAVMYPSLERLKDYLKWRQVDCHINNLYNTCFWALVQAGGMTKKEAEKELQGTTSANKNKILFSRFSINYNNEPEIFKKGSVIFREPQSSATEMQVKFSETQLKKQKKRKSKTIIVVGHDDIIKNTLWDMRPWILFD